jgi:hypothetical protein
MDASLATECSNAAQEKKETEQQRSGLVNFSSSLKVVLIPSRQEYKDAGCNLWWSSEDFSAFQDSARSEVKTLSLHENIHPKEAKAKLYQPNPRDLEDDYGNVNIEDDYFNFDHSRESSMDSERNNSSESDAGVPNFFSIPLLSPVPRRSIPKVNSMECLAARKCKRKHKDREKNGKYDMVSEVIFDEDPHEFAFGASSAAPIFYEDLSLCVAVATEAPLLNKERMSRKAGPKDEESVHVPSLILYMTIPLVGYYVLTYCL